VLRILHLSDIHFGRERVFPSECRNRDTVMAALLDVIRKLPPELRPDMVITTGDIAWHGKQSEFEKACAWYSDLRESIGLPADRLVFCPGNHDLNKSVGIEFKPEQICEDNSTRLDIRKCDEFYTYENSHRLEARFLDYNLFCEKMGMHPYSFIGKDRVTEYSYLIGRNAFSLNGKHYQITCFNSAYLPYDGKVLRDDQMFLGLPQMQVMIEQYAFKDDVYNISVFHHAPRFLYSDEQCSYKGRPSTLDLVYQYSDLVLCGHTETEAIPHKQPVIGGGHLITAGATYYSDTHRNSFSIINIDENEVVSMYSFSWNGNEWQQNFDDISGKNSESCFEWDDPWSQHPCAKLLIRNHDREVLIGEGRIACNQPDDKTLIISNSFEPATRLSFSVTTYFDDSQRGYLRFAHGQCQQKTVAALKAISEINNNIKALAEQARDENMVYGLYYTEGDICISERLVSKEALFEYCTHYKSNIELYNRLEQLENYFDTRFCIPETGFSDQDLRIIGLLESLMCNGNCEIVAPVSECWITLQNKEQFIRLEKVYHDNLKIALAFFRNVRINLFSTNIDLDACHIYLLGAVPDNIAEISRKIQTWEDGDIRRVGLRYPKSGCLGIYRDGCFELPDLPSIQHVAIQYPDQAPIPIPGDVVPYLEFSSIID